MSHKKYILSLDQGTSSSRAVLFDRSGQAVLVAQREFRQYYPQPGWVEHDPCDILNSQFGSMRDILSQVSAQDIEAIALTNQRETTLVWNADTGKPVHNAIVWHCRRTAPLCESLRGTGDANRIHHITGLVPDAYFSAPKIAWILDHAEDARMLAETGKLRFGTVDSWLLWHLTNGRVHATDCTNASRTMLYDIQNLRYDEWLLSLFGIPESMLPEVRDTSGLFGYTKIGGCRIPITAVAGDQQAALFGQICFLEGEVKNTYGTGCFVLHNTGERCVFSERGLLSTIAWREGGRTVYALEGSAFNCGSAIQWLRDGLHIIETSGECDRLAATVPDSGDVIFVPAFTGLGAPYWDMYARGTVLGITRGTERAHIARAVLESIACQSADMIRTMTEESGIPPKELRADGGASKSDLLLQFQADLLDMPVNRPRNSESTALGAAFHAGLYTGFWRDTAELRSIRQTDRLFTPAMTPAERSRHLRLWHRAVERAGGWAAED